MHLDALVITIGGAARIGDDCDFAGLAVQGCGGRIDIASFANISIHQNGCRRCDRDDFVVQQEAGHIEIVDHHVTEQAAGTFNIVDWRRARVTRCDLNKLHLTDLTGINTGPNISEMRVKAAIETDHQFCFVFGNHLETGTNTLSAQINRLFAENGLSGLCGLFDLVRVHVCGGADQHGLNGLIGKDLFH